MQKTTTAAAILIICLLAGLGSAAPIVNFTEFTSVSGNTGVTVSVDPNTMRNCYDTVEFRLTGSVAESFLQSGPAIKLESDISSSDDTAFNNQLFLPTSLDGVGATLFPAGGTESTSELFGVVSTIGNNSLARSTLDYADVVFAEIATGFTYELNFAGDGELRDTVTGTYALESAAAVPEPTAAFALLFAAIAVFAARRTGRQ